MNMQIKYQVSLKPKLPCIRPSFLFPFLQMMALYWITEHGRRNPKLQTTDIQEI